MAYTGMELMAVAGARNLKDGEIVFVGTGLPIVAALLAKVTHAPNLTIVVETGSIDPKPIHTPLAVSDAKCWYKAVKHTGIRDVLGSLLQRGMVDVGFIGGAQIDRYGNVNSTVIGDYKKPSVRLPGSGGACDIAALAKRTIIICVHEKRRFPEKVDYITSPGYFNGSNMRKKIGLYGGPVKVITDLCTFVFDKNQTLVVDTIHPGVTADDIINNTGFAVSFKADVKTTPPPTDKELKILREKIDPQRVYLK
jgi:glutaconate CoA-transferase subunit B